MKIRGVLPLLSLGIFLLAACVTHIKPDVVQNPPPTEKFSAFTAFEIHPVTLPPEHASDRSYQHPLAKIQENVDLKMRSLLAAWRKNDANQSPTRTLLIEPSITAMKFVKAGRRVVTGPFSGSSAIIIQVKITEKETGRVIATPEFYSRAAAWSDGLGINDNLMLTRVADRFTSYLEANYSAAVGGPSGANPSAAK